MKLDLRGSSNATDSGAVKSTDNPILGPLTRSRARALGSKTDARLAATTSASRKRAHKECESNSSSDEDAPKRRRKRSKPDEKEKAPPALSVEQRLAVLKADPSIKIIEFNYVYCSRCIRWIALGAGKYRLQNWQNHCKRKHIGGSSMSRAVLERTATAVVGSVRDDESPEAVAGGNEAVVPAIAPVESARLEEENVAVAQAIAAVEPAGLDVAVERLSLPPIILDDRNRSGSQGKTQPEAQGTPPRSVSAAMAASTHEELMDTSSSSPTRVAGGVVGDLMIKSKDDGSLFSDSEEEEIVDQMVSMPGVINTVEDHAVVAGPTMDNHALRPLTPDNNAFVVPMPGAAGFAEPPRPVNNMWTLRIPTNTTDTDDSESDGGSSTGSSWDRQDNFHPIATTTEEPATVLSSLELQPKRVAQIRQDSRERAVHATQRRSEVDAVRRRREIDQVNARCEAHVVERAAAETLRVIVDKLAVTKLAQGQGRAKGRFFDSRRGFQHLYR